MAKFFVSCQVGFEAELQNEIKSFWFEMMDLDGLPTRLAFPEFVTMVGGIEAELPEHIGYQINFFSKLANRVLIRIFTFEARYYDQLEKEFKKLDLAKWTDYGSVQLKIESHKSRLNNQKNIEEAITKVLNEKKIKVVHDQENALTLLIRLEKDRVVTSLDTSGEHLHRRGYAVYRGEAPIRETLAAFLIQQLEKSCSSIDQLTLIDPFVGSGTLLFEAVIQKYPLFARPYSWLQFLNRPKLFKSESWSKNYRWIKSQPVLDLIGIDQDEKAILSLNKNSELLKKMDLLFQFNLQSFSADSLKIDLTEFKNRPNLWLVTNPPYGERLEQGDAIQILQRFSEELPLKGLIVLHPESWNFNLPKLKLVSKLDFRNQGLRLKLSVYSS